MRADEITKALPHLADASSRIEEAHIAIEDAKAAQLCATAVLDGRIKDAFKSRFNSPLKPVQNRLEHRSGRPSRIDADPELHAFATQRIDQMTFEALADAIADHFPPERRVKKTAIHAWWQRQPNRLG